MKVFVQNHSNDTESLFEGSDEEIERAILFRFPFLRSNDLDDRGDLEAVLEELDRSGYYQVHIEGLPEDDGNGDLTKHEAPDSSSMANSECARAQAGFVPHHQPAFDAAQFLSGKTVNPVIARRSLFHADGDIRKAALIAHGLEVNEANLQALAAIEGMYKSPTNKLTKAEGSVYAYHVTPLQHLPSISAKGLQPRPHQNVDGENVTFVEPEEAGAGIYHEPGKTAMLRFPHHGMGTTEDGERVINYGVPSEHIQVRQPSGWAPISSIPHPGPCPVQSCTANAYPHELHLDRQYKVLDHPPLTKSDPGSDPGSNPVSHPGSIIAAVASGEDVAQAVQRAYDDQFVVEVQLSGKHSNGTLLAHDDKSHSTWLLKPGTPDPGPAAGVREESASQSAREAAFYAVGKMWGLFDYYPRAELLLIDSKPVAAMEFLGEAYKTLAKLDDKDTTAGRRILGPLLQNGTLHQLAFVDAVLGNADDHANNAMADEEGHLKLIDHGASFAGDEFDPAHDQNSFVPGYLRAWASPDFAKLSSNDKLAQLPRVAPEVEERLQVWIRSLHAAELEHTLLQYGIDPGATLGRLAKLRDDVLKMPAAEAINRFWVTV